MTPSDKTKFFLKLTELCCYKVSFVFFSRAKTLPRFVITLSHTLNSASYKVALGLFETSAPLPFVRFLQTLSLCSGMQTVRGGGLQTDSERMLCAVAIIGEGVLSVFAAAGDVWMGLHKGPILSRRRSSRGLALSFL